MPLTPENRAPGERLDGRRTGVSVIVATLGRPDDLHWLICSLGCQTARPRQVIVVDASDLATFQTNELALSLLDDVTKVEHIPSASGLTRQRNIGVERAAEGLVVFLDDDVVLAPTYLEEIVKGFDRYPRALGLTGTILLERPPNRVAGRLRRLAGFRDFRSGEPTWLGEVGYVMQPSHDQELHVLPGCDMAFRREVFDLLELRFDESLSGYALAEDSIFSSQVRRFGPLLQLTAPKLFHNATQVARWSEDYASWQIVNVARLGRLTRSQFGVKAGAIELRIALRGLRGATRMVLSGEPGAAWRLTKLTCATMVNRATVPRQSPPRPKV